MRAKLAVGLLLLVMFASIANAENQAAKIPHNTFWGYWDSGSFDPRSVGIPIGDAFHVTIVGPVSKLQRLTDDDLKQIFQDPPTDPEKRANLMLSALAQTHPWYMYMLNNQQYGTFFLISIEPMGTGYKNRHFVWPDGLTLGITTSAADTVIATRVYTGTDFQYRPGRNVIDQDCTLVALVDGHTKKTVDIPFDRLICKRSGFEMPRGILGIPSSRTPLTKENITGVVWLMNGKPVVQNIAGR